MALPARGREPAPSLAMKSGRLLADTIWQRELVEFVQRRRALAVKLTFPLLVGLPLLYSQAPPFYAAMALTMLVAIIGALGAAAVLTRERSAGITLRFRLLPVRPGPLLVERLAATAFIDFVQVLPVLALIAVRHPDRVRWWPTLLLATAAVLLTGNVLGAGASTLSRSPGEVMLYVFIPLLPALFLSSVFVPLSPPLASLSPALPFFYLHEALLGALGGQAALPLLEVTLAGAGCLVGAAGLAGWLGRRVLESD